MRTDRRSWWTDSVSVYAVGLLARLINMHKIYLNGHYHTPVIDGMYQLRIVELMLHGRTTWPLVDHWLAFPSGAVPYWPPGFDTLLAVLGCPVWLATGNMTTVETWLGWCMPVLGAVTPVVIFLLLRMTVRHRVVAWVGGLFAALEWELVRVGLLGSIDHHGFGALFLALMLMLAACALHHPKPSHFRLLGLVCGLSFAFFTAAPVLPLFLLAGFAWMAWLERDRPVLVAWRITFRWVTVGTVAAVLWAGAVWTHLFSTVYLSGFHVVLAGVGWLIPELLVWSMRKGFPIRSVMLGLGAVGVLVVVAVLAIAGSDMVGIFFRQDLNAMVVRESEGFLFFNRPGMLLIHPLFWLFPPALFVLTRQAIREQDRFSVLLLVVLTGTMTMGLAQVRFLHYAAVSLLAGGIPAAETIGMGIIRRWRRFGRPLVHVLTALTLSVQIAIGWALFQAYREIQPPLDSLRLMQLATVLRTETPSPGDILDPERQPAWGVLVPQWHYGHHVLFKGRRPEVGTPFGGTEPFLGRIRDCLSAMTATSEGELAAVCDRVGARYLVVRAIGAMAFTAYMEAAAASWPARADALRVMPWHRSFLYRLTVNARQTIPGLTRFRLVWEEPMVGKLTDAGRWRVYEVTGVADSEHGDGRGQRGGDGAGTPSAE